MKRAAVALVHYPCLDKEGRVYTTSITNLDVHDIARSARTYDVSAYYLVTPIEAQRALAESIAGFWETNIRGQKVPTRAEAMQLVRSAHTLEEVLATETELLGEAPLVVATSAREVTGAVAWPALRRRLDDAAGLVLVFGTGYGLAPEAIALADVTLKPIYGASAYNHLSVRSAAAIALDRLLSPDHADSTSS